MTSDEKQEFIRLQARRNKLSRAGEKILWGRHGITELVNEEWNRAWVEEGLQHCWVIEDYPSLHRPLPDCLVLGWLTSGEPFHAVIGMDESSDRLFVITVYKPSAEEWEDDWRTRRE